MGLFQCAQKGISLKFWTALFHYSYKWQVHGHRLHGQQRHINPIDTIGTLAAVLTTISFFPNAWPIIIANVIAFSMALMILSMKLRYR